MTVEKKIELAGLLEPVIGSPHITAHPDLFIDDVRPSALVEPGSAEEVAQCLSVCARLNAAVIPAGLKGWLEGGNPIRRADLVLSAKRMNRILEYSPPDLTVTVEAGITIGDLNAELGRERQWLPLDPPGSPTATVGAIASCASVGALRLGFGTPRDYVIGLRLAHADGTQSKSGGKVAKNVAGYDMNKLYVGSFGTLAMITELTFKLRPLPERVATLLITSRQQESLGEIAKRILASEAEPVSVFLTSNLTVTNVSRGLLIRFADGEQAVEHQLSLVCSLLSANEQCNRLSDSEADAAWAQVADFGNRVGTMIRASVPLSTVDFALGKLLSGAQPVAVADIGTGIIKVVIEEQDESAINLIKQLRAEVAQFGGTLFIERASADVRRRADAWGDVGKTAALMRAIKAKLDPDSLLNPGRFVAGI